MDKIFWGAGQRGGQVGGGEVFISEEFIGADTLALFANSPKTFA